MADIGTGLEQYGLQDSNGGAVVAIPAQGLLIGRNPEAGLCLPEPSTSWHHAQAVADERGVWITDLGSRNGTFVDGSRLAAQSPALLGSGSVLAVGDHSFQCVRTAAAAAANRPATQYIPASAGDVLTVGRAPDCNIVLDDPTVSWHHARIQRQGAGWFVEDLGSANGTFRNEQSVKSCSLGPNDRLRIGLHTFQLGDEGLACTTETGQIRVDVVGLTLNVFQNGKLNTYLNDVTITINPRELVAIVGASGAGKSTLLLALNGYQPATSGRVYLNDVDFYTNREMFRTSVGYVPQENIVHKELIVENAFRYAAQLRLPGDTSTFEIEKLVSQVLEELDLNRLRHKRISALSGGEQKRVNIGLELLTRPSVLYLDEPTTGQHAGLEDDLTLLFKRLAKEGRTVVVVTHSVPTLEHFDRVIWIARGGTLAYYGPPTKLAAYFGEPDLKSVYKMMDKMAERGESPPPFREHLGGASPHTPAPALQRLKPSRTSGLAQFMPLVRRYVEGIANDTKNLALWLIQAPLVAVVISLIFSPDMFGSSQKMDDRHQFPIHEAPHLLFMLAFCASCFALLNSCREIVKERKLFERERPVGLHAWPYVLSKLVVLSFVSLLQCIFLLVVVNLRIPFHAEMNDMLQMLLVLFLGAVNSIILGLFISTRSTKAEQAITFVALILLLQVILSGLIPLENMNAAFQGLASLNILRWIYGGLCGGVGLEGRLNDLPGKPFSDNMPDLYKTPIATALWVLAAMIVVVLPLVRTSLVHTSYKRGE